MFNNGPRSNMRRDGIFSRMPLFFKIWFAIVFAYVATTFAITVMLGVNVINNPESVGVFVGRIAHGFNSVQ